MISQHEMLAHIDHRRAVTWVFEPVSGSDVERALGSIGICMVPAAVRDRLRPGNHG